MAVASPCINVCRMDDVSGLCVGCWRTIDEIAGWASRSEAQRIEVLAKVEKRRGDGSLNGAELRGECAREGTT